MGRAAGELWTSRYVFSQSEESCVCVDADDVAIGGTMDVWVAGTGWDNVVAGTGSDICVALTLP